MDSDAARFMFEQGLGIAAEEEAQLRQLSTEHLQRVCIALQRDFASAPIVLGYVAGLRIVIAERAEHQLVVVPS